MGPQKYEMNEKRLIRWLLIATLGLLVLVLGLQAWRMLFPGTPVESAPAAPQATEPLSAAAENISPGKTAMIEDVRARNPALSFDGLAALTAEELEQLCEADAPPDRVPIGLSLAAQRAGEYAGTLEADSVTWDADPELDESPAHYEVELHHITLGDFEYKIDAYTGEVLEGVPDILRSTYVPVSGGEAQASVPAAQQPASSGEPSALTGEEAAKAAAFAHAGVAETDAAGLRVRSDWEDGVRIYEIEFLAGGIEYEYEIEAATGAVRKAGQKWGASGGAQTGLISQSDAQAAALAHAGVRSENVGRIRGELDEEGGVRVYEIEFTANGIEYGYEIDARTGAVRKAEQEGAD